MYDLNERVSYLQGLLDGLDIADDSKEGKAISVIADILEEVAYVISDLIEAQRQRRVHRLHNDDLADLKMSISRGFCEVECPKCGAG